MIWKRTDIEDDGLYFLQLCQDKDRNRYFVLANIEDTERNPDCLLRTEVITDKQALLNRDLKSIAETTKLTDGRRFVFDVHGVWMTESESKLVDEEQKGVGRVAWEGGEGPRFAPK